jgi:cell division protein FtsB
MKYFFGGKFYTDKEGRVSNPKKAKKLSKENLVLAQKIYSLKREIEKLRDKQNTIDNKFRKLVDWPEPRVLKDWERVAY